MICPYCGEEMKKGYVQCRDGMYWNEKKRPIPALMLGGGRTIQLSYDPSTVEAYCCENCRKVIIEYQV